MSDFDRDKIIKQFFKLTGICSNSTYELSEAFPVSLDCHMMFINTEYEFKLTPSGKNIKNGSIKKYQIGI